MEWLELKKEFENLSGELARHRIDYQWGAAGTYYLLTGASKSAATRKFEALIEISGRKLSEIPERVLTKGLRDLSDPVARWHEFTKQFSGAFEHNFVATQRSDTGYHMGNIYTGTVYNPAETSALLCLKLSSIPADTASEQEKNSALLARLNRFLHNEAEQRGYLWLVLGFVVTVVLAALAL